MQLRLLLNGKRTGVASFTLWLAQDPFGLAQDLFSVALIFARDRPNPKSLVGVKLPVA